MKQAFSKLTLAVLSFVLFATAGCASINSVSLTPIPPRRTQVVRAEATKIIFLAFSFDNDFIDTLVTDLKQQCPNGVVSGILTKDETISYVLVFKKRVIATGFCNTASGAPVAAKPGKKTASLETEIE